MPDAVLFLLLLLSSSLSSFGLDVYVSVLQSWRFGYDLKGVCLLLCECIHMRMLLYVHRFSYLCFFLLILLSQKI